MEGSACAGCKCTSATISEVTGPFGNLYSAAVLEFPRDIFRYVVGIWRDPNTNVARFEFGDC